MLLLRLILCPASVRDACSVIGGRFRAIHPFLGELMSSPQLPSLVLPSRELATPAVPLNLTFVSSSPEFCTCRSRPAFRELIRHMNQRHERNLINTRWLAHLCRQLMSEILTIRMVLSKEAGHSLLRSYWASRKDRRAFCRRTEGLLLPLQPRARPNHTCAEALGVYTLSHPD